MKLTIEGLQDATSWQKAGISLPSYDVTEVAARTKENPVWVHFGIGNIFRVFLGGIADRLLNLEVMDRGITCVESFDFDVVDQIYQPYDNLGLSVILNNDGTRDMRVLGSMCEAVKAISSDAKQWNRLKTIFSSPTLQLVSFTITEKGYALRNADGNYFPFIEKDIENGPEKASSAMAIVTAMLWHRYQVNKQPLALVSMDNVATNGALLRKAVIEIGNAWKDKGFVDDDFISYISDESLVAFPWTMIDKITPRPSVSIANDLEALGVEKMQPVITSKNTYIAPFVNAEGPQYLVIEDNFPNGRPQMEKANLGVYFADRETVNKSERMKVTACLNPIHSALGPYGILLGYDLFADEMNDPDMRELARQVGEVEGMRVVPDPKILSPKQFLDECLNVRFPNPYLGDTNQRLCVDISQGISVRFGVTIRAYVERYGDAKMLNGIPIGLAGWLRYILGVDDEGNTYALSPDPMNEMLQSQLKGVSANDPSTVGDCLKPILSNENIFGINLYEAGIGERVEEIFKQLCDGPGSVRKTIKKYLYQ